MEPRQECNRYYGQGAFPGRRGRRRELGAFNRARPTPWMPALHHSRSKRPGGPQRERAGYGECRLTAFFYMLYAVAINAKVRLSRLTRWANPSSHPEPVSNRQQ